MGSPGDGRGPSRERERDLLVEVGAEEGGGRLGGGGGGKTTRKMKGSVGTSVRKEE